MHFMKNMAIVGGSLAFVACGAGAYSLDALKPASSRIVDRIGGQGSLWAIGRPPVHGDFVQSMRPQDNRDGLRSAS